ncbi:cache domain-containing protein [Alkalihalobacterium elongatum]|uniref:cache domain-containing protein n=1 Tax=Alkalihalobacterium elongatum TaxID=2675466 RepID=UPI001C1F874E|nr:cache domain-containing protein [Alkalihalobacterium elongatum]
MVAKLVRLLGLNSIKGRLRFSIICFALIIGLISTITIILIEKKNLEEHAIGMLEQTIVLQKKAIEKWLEERKIDINSISRLPEIRMTEEEKIKEVFAAYENHPDFFALVYSDKEGVTKVDSFTNPGTDITDRNFFINAMKGESSISDVMVSKVTNKPVIIVASPVLNYEQQFQGVVFVVVSLETIENVMENLSNSRSMETYLLRQDGYLITEAFYQDADIDKGIIETSPILKVKVESELYGRAMQNQFLETTYMNFVGEEVFGTYDWVSDNQWLIIGEVKKENVYASFYRIILVLTLVLLLASVLAWINIKYISKLVEHPISKLVLGSRLIREKNYKYHMDDTVISKGPVEFRELCYTFNEMSATISEKIELLEYSKEKYKHVIDNIREVLFQTDEAGAWTFLNQSWEKITGFTVDESLGKTFIDFLYIDDRKQNRRLFEALINQEISSCRQEVRYITKDHKY